MGCCRLRCRHFVVFFVSVAVLDLFQPFFYELQIAYLEHRQIRQPISVDRIRYFNSFCNLNADKRGYHQRVISYSIYGDFSRTEVAKRYLIPLKETIRKINRAYPGWIVRIYHNLTADDEAWPVFENTFELVQNSVDLCNISQVMEDRNLGDIFAMTWRWLPLLDEMVDVFMSRDSDSPILAREINAVREWLASDRIFHIMRDNPMHCVPLLGGLWGVKMKEDRSRIVRAAQRILTVNHLHDYDYDQKMLIRHIWPVARTNMMAHDSYCCQYWPPSRPFPTQREGSAFVGMVGSSTDDYKPLVCPKRCRPNTTSDWLFC